MCRFSVRGRARSYNGNVYSKFKCIKFHRFLFFFVTFHVISMSSLARLYCLVIHQRRVTLLWVCSDWIEHQRLKINFFLHSIEAPSKKVISDSLNNNMVHYYMIQSVRVVSCVDAQRWLAFPSPLEPLNLSKKILCLLWQIGFLTIVLRRRRNLLKYFLLTHSLILIKVNDKSKKAIAMKPKYVCWGKHEEDEEWNNWQVFVVLLTCFFCPRRRDETIHH